MDEAQHIMQKEIAAEKVSLKKITILAMTTCEMMMKREMLSLRICGLFLR
jgi:hypothetical protein